MVNQPREPKGKSTGGRFAGEGSGGAAGGLPPTAGDPDEGDWPREVTDPALWRETRPDSEKLDLSRRYRDTRQLEKYVKHRLGRDAGDYAVPSIALEISRTHLDGDGNVGTYVQRMYTGEDGERRFRLACQANSKRLNYVERLHAQDRLDRLVGRDREDAFYRLPEDRRRLFLRSTGMNAVDGSEAWVDGTHVVDLPSVNHVLSRYALELEHDGWKRDPRGRWVIPEGRSPRDAVRVVARHAGVSVDTMVQDIGYSELSGSDWEGR